MPLVKKETALLNLIDLDPRVYFIYNLTTRDFEYANPAFYAFFQMKPLNLKSEKILKMVNKEDRFRFEKTCCSILPGVMHNGLECSIKLPDASERFISISLLLDKQEDQSILMGFLEDITLAKTKRITEEENAIAKDLKRRALRHDIAGTLGFIPTFIHLLIRKTEPLEDPQIPVLLSSIESISKETLIKIKEYMSEEIN